MSSYPNIPPQLISSLSKSFPDSCKSIKDYGDLRYAQGQQDIIDHMRAIEKKQLDSKGAR
jgi:hypothetical protein